MIVDMLREMSVIAIFFFIVVFELNEGVNVDRTLFGTKTAYDWVAVPVSISDNTGMFVEYEGHQCRAIHVNMVLRHGYRLPGSKDVTQMKELAKKIREHKMPDLFGFIDTWELKLEESPGLLNALGRQEMIEIARRTAKRFQLLITNANTRIELISSDMNRTIESGISFGHGLDRHSVPDVSINDTLIRIYKSCPYYETAVGSQTLKDEKDMFISSAPFQRLLRKIEENLGFGNQSSLTKNEANRMWELCALDLLTGVEDQWCSFMDNGDRNILEYAADIKNYFDSSYGNGVSGDIHCGMLWKLVKLMDDAQAGHRATSNNYTVGSFMFGHVGTILGTLTALGLFHDKPVISGRSVMNDNRLFKTGRIVPMAGNVGFAMYACADTTTRNRNKTQYAIKLFFNEREMILPQFTNKSMVWYDDFKAVFGEAASCDVSAVCKDTGDPSRASYGLIKGNITALILAVLSFEVLWYWESFFI